MSLIGNVIGTAATPFTAQAKAIAGMVLLAAVLAVGAYVMMLRGEISSQNEKIGKLTGDNVILNSNIETLKLNIKTLEDVNASNQATIDMFKEERKKSEAAIQSLAKKDVVNKQKINDLNAYIDLLSKDPSNDGALAPVLSQTLSAIRERKAESK